MLNKIFRYDMKSIGRILLPLYIAVCILPLIIGVAIRFSANPTTDTWILNNMGNFQSNNSLLAIFMMVIIIAYVVLVVSSSLITLVVILKHFSRNFFGNNGYLTMSLPIKTWQHLFSKTLSGGVWSLISVIISILSWILLVLPMTSVAKMITTLYEEISSITTINMGEVGFHIVALIICLFIICIAETSKLYAALSIGHMFKNHKKLWSVIFYSIFYIPTQTIFNKILSMNSLEYFEISSFIISIITTLIFSCITYYILDRKVDLL